jgi:hypothetical protein
MVRGATRSTQGAAMSAPDKVSLDHLLVAGGAHVETLAVGGFEARRPTCLRVGAFPPSDPDGSRAS